MKHLILLTFVFLLSFNLLFAQDISKHSFALNIGGFHELPVERAYTYRYREFHFSKHLGATYRYSLSPRQSLRFSTDYRNRRDWSREVHESGRNIKYNEFQTGIGYEFIFIKKKLEAYAGYDFIGLYSKSLNNSWFNQNTTNETISRLAYGGNAFLGLRYNASDKLAFGLETNARYLFNKSRQEVRYNSNNSIPTIHSYNLLNFNPISAITVKYRI